MGVTLFYYGNKHKFTDRMKDMKHMICQQEEYDLSTDEGKENTWHAVNAMFLGAAAVILGDYIAGKITAPIERKRLAQMRSEDFKNGQLCAYRNVMESIGRNAKYRNREVIK